MEFVQAGLVMLLALLFLFRRQIKRAFNPGLDRRRDPSSKVFAEIIAREKASMMDQASKARGAKADDLGDGKLDGK